MAEALSATERLKPKQPATADWLKSRVAEALSATERLKLTRYQRLCTWVHGVAEALSATERLKPVGKRGETSVLCGGRGIERDRAIETSHSNGKHMFHVAVAEALSATERLKLL